MNQAKAMKATLKSSTEKKQPIESTTPNNEVLPKLRSTLSARNIMLGPNYDEEINKTVVCLYYVSVEKVEFNEETCIWIRFCSGKSCQVKQTIEPFKKFGFPPPRCSHSSYRNCRLCRTEVMQNGWCWSWK